MLDLTADRPDLLHTTAGTEQIIPSFNVPSIIAVAVSALPLAPLLPGQPAFIVQIEANPQATKEGQNPCPN